MLWGESTFSSKSKGTATITDVAQAIASRLQDPEHHTTPPVVEQVKDKVLEDHVAKASTSGSGQSAAPKSTDAKSSSGGSARQVSGALTV